MGVSNWIGPMRRNEVDLSSEDSKRRAKEVIKEVVVGKSEKNMISVRKNYMDLPDLIAML